MLDNPCLIRSKDGSQLIADFGSGQCYVQKATVTTKYGRSWYMNTIASGHFINDSYHKEGVNGCIVRNRFVSIDSSWDGPTGDYYCLKYRSTYTADSGWTKLNNSFQEYRENF